MSEQEVSPEEQERLAREIAEEIRKLTVQDVLINTLMTVSSIGYRRLGVTPETQDDRDLEQARLAIETMRALTPVLERFVPAELVRDFNTSVANLQLAYAKAASEAGESGGQAASEAAAPGGQTPGVSEPAGSEAQTSRPAADRGARPSEAEAAGESNRDASGGQTPAMPENDEEHGAG